MNQPKDNWEAVVPASLREEVDRRIQSFVNEPLVLPLFEEALGKWAKSLVMLAVSAPSDYEREEAAAREWLMDVYAKCTEDAVE